MFPAVQTAGPAGVTVSRGVARENQNYQTNPIFLPRICCASFYKLAAYIRKSSQNNLGSFGFVGAFSERKALRHP
jgi:hypothetical protein